MPIDTRSCILIRCDGCNDVAGDEDTGTTWHFDDLEHAVKALVVDMVDDYDPGAAWAIDSDRALCPRCLAVAACENAGGHDWGYLWVSMDGATGHRHCRREHCPGHEQKPVETPTDLRLV